MRIHWRDDAQDRRVAERIDDAQDGGGAGPEQIGAVQRFGAVWFWALARSPNWEGPVSTEEEARMRLLEEDAGTGGGARAPADPPHAGI